MVAMTSEKKRKTLMNQGPRVLFILKMATSDQIPPPPQKIF